MFTKSIRWRMQLWLASLLGVILSGFGVTAYQLHRVNRMNQIDEELERRVSALSADLRGRLSPGRPPFEPGPPQRRGGGEGMFPRGPGDPRPEPREVEFSRPTLNLFDEAQTNGFYFVTWSRGGAVKRSLNSPAEVPLPRPNRDDTAVHARTREGFRESYRFTGIGDCALAGLPIAGDLAALRRFAWLLVAAGGTVLGLGLGGGWLLSSRALQPIAEITSTASRIADGNLAERINVADTDSELGRLAAVLNSTFTRLEAAFAQQKQFTADASHELRTPLTVMITEAQTALARERTAAEYRETIEACLETAQQMRRLAQSLLELAGFDAGQQALARRPLDLAAVCRGCIELVQPLAAERRAVIEAALAPAPVVGDADRLGQVVTNLLVNAIRYGRDEGRIRLTTTADGRMAQLAVTDTGPGIAAEDLPHVFKRFFRGDKSRARAEGRTGLGLAICKAIVDAHGGSIEVSSPPGEGATFTVRLPAA